MNEVARAVELLLAGDVIGLPTETVYGLAADATQPHAVRRVFAIKGRPVGHPLIVHLADQSWLDQYCVGDLSRAKCLANAFWPGPLTLILPKNPARVPDEVTGGLGTVAVRVPAHPLALEVIGELGRPVAAPSANRFGAVSPTTRDHVVLDLGDRVPLILDGGPCRIGIESTILDLSRDQAFLLRPGAITAEQLSVVLGEPVLENDGQGPQAPGTLASHYAPHARVVLVAPQDLWNTVRALMDGGSVGVLALSGAAPPAEFGIVPGRLDAHGLVRAKELVVYGVQGGIEAAAHDLYAGLRALDEAGCSVIVSPLPELRGIGVAVLDRLERAAAPRPDQA